MAKHLICEQCGTATKTVRIVGVGVVEVCPFAVDSLRLLRVHESESWYVDWLCERHCGDCAGWHLASQVCKRSLVVSDD